MKAPTLAVAAVGILLVAGGRFMHGQNGAELRERSLHLAHVGTGSSAIMGLRLPSQSGARMVLNSLSRHPEWAHVRVDGATIPAFVIYPDRPDRAPVVLLTARDQRLNDWMRAVADQIASAGFIAMVPGPLLASGRPPGGSQLLHQAKVMHDYAVAFSGGNGRRATLRFDRNGADNGVVDVTVDSSTEETRAAHFSLTDQAWPNVIAFLTEATDNRFEPSSDRQLFHAHAAQGDHGAVLPEPFYKKTDELPANYNAAKTALARSPRRSAVVDIPVGTTKLHTWVYYPQTTAKAPVVVVMQNGPGMDDWHRAVGDQLAYHGFIAVVPDLLSGMGPHGGNTDSFEYPDDIGRAEARLTPVEAMRRYLAAREYGVKLPESSGKAASMGFCMGGGHSWVFAAEAPETPAVAFYGGPIPDDATLGKVHAPVLALLGELDGTLSLRTEAAAAKMKALGRSFEMHVYPRATHSFLQRQELAENLKATEDAWPRAIAFLKHNTM